MKIVERTFAPRDALTLVKAGFSPALARALVSRGASTLVDVNPTLADLLPYNLLKGAMEMAVVLADAIEQRKKILIVADYDADGATSCSIGLLALRAMGANVSYIIPDRIEHGYGLTPAITELACNCEFKPDYLLTVDNGIASHEGIRLANSLGVPVLVTDHHLPDDKTPEALCMVNPNQRGCTFPSKSLAGCGVIYYVMWALEDELISRGVELNEEFSVQSLLPIVAVGTVADVVALDRNNRILVNEGLLAIRKGKCPPGIEALAKVSGKNPRVMAASDIAFAIGPRINAAGRLESMDVGVECLTAPTMARASALAEILHKYNNQRKEIEGEMTEEAVRRLLTTVQPGRYTAVLHSADWHTGVIGIVAGRIKERVWRPTFALAEGKLGEYKGSGRSIPGFHLRDALDLVQKRYPGILKKFGGHAMAAGVTLYPGKVEEFAAAFEEIAKTLLKPSDLLQQLEVDGSLSSSEMCLETVKSIKERVWGQAFPEPTFFDEFSVVSSRVIGGGQHLKLTLEKDGVQYDAVKFRHTDAPPSGKLRAAYKLDANAYRDETNLQLLLEYFEQD